MLTIKQLRYTRGWSQEYLAQQARVSVRTISMAETGKTRTRFNTLCRIADVFGVDPQALVDEYRAQAQKETAVE